MKGIGTLLFLIGLGILTLLIVGGLKANYQYSTQFESNWELADKSSTIAQKSEYVDKFVSALEASGLHGTNSKMFFPTPTSSFDSNMEALKSLQGRLHQIKTMDEQSFAYQTAIQQITEQEQGQAQEMLSVLKSCWYRVHWYWLWNGFIMFFMIAGMVIIGGIGIALLVEDTYY